MLNRIDRIKHEIQKLRHHIAMSYKVADDETKFWEAYPRQIGPSEIYELRSHLTIDGETYIETIIAGIPDAHLRGYPKGLNRRIMNEITELNMKGCRISISFSLVPVHVAEAADLLDDVVNMNRMNQITARKQLAVEGVETVPLDMIFDYEDHKENYKKFHDRKHNVFHSMLLIVLAAKNIDTLRTTKSLVMQKLKGKLVLAESPQWRQKETFLLAQAFPGWKEYASVEVFSETAAVLAPLRTPNVRMDIEGQYYGIDVRTNKKIVVDERKLSSKHKLFIGPTGSGKTFTMLMLLMRAHDLLGKKIIITSNKPDVTTDISAVARYYGTEGAIISIGPRGDNINPLHILYDEKEMGDDSYEYILAYDSQKGLLQKFFDIFLKGTSPPQRSRLDRYINEVYRSKGIYRNDHRTWKNADWPTISDLRDLFKRDMDDDVSAEALYHNTFQFDHEGELGYMNRRTNINIGADFVFLDMSNIPQIAREAMNVLTVGVLAMRFKTNMTKQTVIAMDEAGNIIRNPEIAEFLLRLISQGRSFGIEAWFATQQPTDLVAANVSEQMKTNIPVNIILGENMQPDSIDIVQRYFKLTDEESRYLLTATVGKGILRVQNLSWAIDFKPTEQEMNVIKGKDKISKTSQKPLTHSGFTVKKELSRIAEEYKILFDPWVEGMGTGNGDADSLNQTMKDRGYIKKSVQNAFDTGMVGMWIQKDILKDGKIYNQSVDHYSMGIQIHSYFAMHGVISEISNTDGPDVIATVNDKKISIEYERPGTHTPTQIFQKHQENLQKYDTCIVVVTAQNQKEVEDAVGAKDVIPRGSRLKTYLDNHVQNKTNQAEP